MKKILLGLMAAAVLCIVPMSASAERSFDFSDLDTLKLDLPFTVSSVTSLQTEHGARPEQVYHISESLDAVVKKLGKMYDSQKTVGLFVIMGITKQTDGSYEIVLGYKNEHNYANLKAEGSGCALSFQPMPVSYVSGAYDIAAYGFVLPNSGTVSLDLNTDE